MGVARPPARLVIAQAFGSGGEGLCRSSQAENLCAIPVPPLRQSRCSHLLFFSFFFFCDAPSSGFNFKKRKKRGTRGQLLWPPRGLRGGRPAAGSQEETATLTAKLPIEWTGGLIHGGERPGVPMTTRHPLCSVSLTQMTNFPAFKC